MTWVAMGIGMFLLILASFLFAMLLNMDSEESRYIKEMESMHLVRTEAEIDDLKCRCFESMQDGAGKYPGMTYEQGVVAAIDWLTTHDDDDADPMADETEEAEAQDVEAAQDANGEV